ncbi:MAG: UvrD-helicase domain-containing protein [Acidobacteria bacterium]|nr:UvrD-helicase domain-containing protein [Acidobacteriota bacterium]
MGTRVAREVDVAGLPFDDAEAITTGMADGLSQLPDADARLTAIDPTRNVVLEASAGTGKTRVLVDRYLKLLQAGVDPSNILAITFTRKSAAEMRQRILDRLRQDASASKAGLVRWRELRDRLGEIAISTIDAFCLSLLREFPLEAGVDPAFELADDTEAPRLAEESLDHTLRVARRLARRDRDVSLLFAQLGEARLRVGLGSLLARRAMAADVLSRFLAGAPPDLTAEVASTRLADRLRDTLVGVRGGLATFLADGPVGHPRFIVVARDIAALGRRDLTEPGAIRAATDHVQTHFLTQDGKPRQRLAPCYRREHSVSEDAWKRHREQVVSLAAAVHDCVRSFRRDLNAVLARGLHRVFRVACREYRRTLDRHGVLDFGEVLARAVSLVGEMDEFARSRFRLESRYRHVLVDEFQDTSRQQWQLVSLLIRSWAEGAGAAEDRLPPSIFIVGDRKQSIYGFRDADPRVLAIAGREIAELRGGDAPDRAIVKSFRAVPGLLGFTNELFDVMQKTDRPDAFTYDPSERFPDAAIDRSGALGIVAADTPESCAAIVSEEIEELLASGSVRDRQSGNTRAVRPSDIAILFRSRESHREFFQALDERGVPAYVYKGLGFFDAQEIKDVLAVIKYLADPASNLRAAAFLRTRLVRLSDPALLALRQDLASRLLRAESWPETLDPEDRRVLERLGAALPRWVSLVDRIPPSELLDTVLRESAYRFETLGSGRAQARENLKKLRSLVRRLQNRGYATLVGIAEHLDRLSLGDESNAIVDAVEAVSLMTVHAAKGLEFPVVFIVNLSRGTGTRRSPVRIAIFGDTGRPSVSIGGFQSEADEEEQARDREETKRLLYVAVTRARDRVYLASALKDGELRPVRGSLGDVLPRSLRDVFARARERRPGDTVEWLPEPGKEPQVFRVAGRRRALVGQ